MFVSSVLKAFDAISFTMFSLESRIPDLERDVPVVNTK